MRVAFVGLGIMGHAMATNLVKAGHEVTVWNRTPGKLVEGAGVAPTPGAAAQGAEVVWLCVSDTDAVESVIFGADGVEASLTEGMIIADSSTISPSATVKFAERVAGERRGLGGCADDGVEDWSARRDAGVYCGRRARGRWTGSNRCSRRWERRFSAWARPARGRPRSLP